MQGRPVRRRVGAAGVVVVLAALLAASMAHAQAHSQRRDQRSTLSRRTAGGGDFPTWEREVESGERSPLPLGRPGRFVPSWTQDLGGAPSGVAVAGGSTLVVPLDDGRVILVGPTGLVGATLDAKGRITLPPVATGSLVLVAAGERVVAIDGQDIAWSSQSGGRIVRPVAHAGHAAYVAREGGTLERISLRDGRREWLVQAGTLAAGPSASGHVVGIGIGGDVVGLDPETGEEIFRLPLGERVDSVLLTESMAYAAGMGVTGRSRDVTPLMAGWPLGARGRQPGRPFRLRVGGTCAGEAIPLDDSIVFPCADGYVRSIGRRKGTGDWKTDLPAATTARPVPDGSRLDFVIPLSRHVVALDSDGGGVCGWVTLPDEDETFVGSSARAGSVLATVTSFDRLVAWRWEWDPEGEEDEDESRRTLRPGEDAQGARSRSPVPIMRR